MSKAPITAKGAKKLRKQLKELKTVKRPRITQAIAEARAHGDLSENAEYHAAREQQSFLEGRIAAIESALADGQIIDVTTINANGNVVFGATVDLVNLEDDAEVTYQIVVNMLPPGFKTLQANSLVNSASIILRAWSLDFIPDKLGAISEITRSTFRPCNSFRH